MNFAKNVIFRLLPNFLKKQLKKYLAIKRCRDYSVYFHECSIIMTDYNLEIIETKNLEACFNKEMVSHLKTLSDINEDLSLLVSNFANSQSKKSSITVFHEDETMNLKLLKIDEQLMIICEKSTTEKTLVVCGWCSKIKNNTEFLTTEEYLLKKFGIVVSHTICPQCKGKLKSQTTKT